jgi:uncharacterized membrane protein SirB2
VCQLLVTICVALSLALFTLGAAVPTSGVFLRTLSFSKPMAIVGPILDTVLLSRTIEDVVCEE